MKNTVIFGIRKMTKNLFKQNLKPGICPICGGKVVPIVYGMPTGDLEEKADRGEVVLGGCCIALDENGRSIDPKWACINCDFRE